MKDILESPKNSVTSLKVTLIALIVVAFSACNKQDKEDPTVVILGIENNEGEPVTSFEAGESLVVHVQMEDNELLNQVKIELTGDGTYSEGAGYISESGFFSDWTGVEISKLEGRSAEKRVNITLSDTIQGWWGIEATVLDGSGRLGETASAQIEVINQNAPQFEVINQFPALVDGEWIVAPRQALKIVGVIYDSAGLDMTSVRMLNATGGQLSSTTLVHNGLVEFELSSIEYVIPLVSSSPLFLEFESINLDGFGSVHRLELNVTD
ncbi:MAG: hypothetical protein ACI943_001354 [Gammaproteobacteria bacterium]